jgi:hypothetical protein
LYEYGEEIIRTGHGGGDWKVLSVGYAFVGGFEESLEGKTDHSSNSF